jgi:hypothetical protein
MCQNIFFQVEEMGKKFKTDYCEGSNTPCTSSCNPWNFGLCYYIHPRGILSRLKQKTNKASKEGAAENKTNPETKTTNILMNPVSNCQAIAASAIIIMFQGEAIVCGCLSYL